MRLSCCWCLADGFAVHLIFAQCTSTLGLAGSHHWRNSAQCRALNGTRPQGTPRKANKGVLMLCPSVEKIQMLISIRERFLHDEPHRC